MIRTIRWPEDEKLYFLGRNGYGKCTGLEFDIWQDVVEIRPVTSRGAAGRAKLRVPLKAIARLANGLTALHRSRRIRPRLRRARKSKGSLSDRDLAAVLVALRSWQQRLVASAGNVGIPVWDHFNDLLTPLSIEEIDGLCERLNCQLQNA